MTRQVKGPAASDAPCPGGCNRDYRRAQISGAEHDLEPVLGEPVWCRWCAGRIRQTLADLVEIYCRLEDNKGATTRRAFDQPIARGRATSRTPSREVEDQDELVRLLIEWDTAIREARGVRVEAAYGPEVHALKVAYDSLNRHLDWALAHDGIGVDLGRELLAIRGRLREVTRSGEGAQRRMAPCPRCELRTLSKPDGGEYIACGNCGRLLTEEEYDDVARHALTGTAR